MNATRLAVVVALLAVVGCGDRYDVTFKCAAGAADCPAGEECPTVPLGSGGCDDLPGLFGHEPTKVDVGRPLGCMVGLAYGNPYYSNEQERCICKKLTPMSPVEWLCPL